MINDKCSGFVLITVLFVVVSAFSAVLMVAYPLVSESRDHTHAYVSNMRFQRVKRGLLGRLADQRGGQFVSCKGHVSEYIGGGGAAAQGNIVTRAYGRRHFTSMGSSMHVSYPEPYEYHEFWQGYRGKRYVHPLVSDNWRDDWDKDDGVRQHALLTDYGFPFAFSYGCGIDFVLGQYMVPKTKQLGHVINVVYYSRVMLKDYSPERGDNEFNLILVGSRRSEMLSEVIEHMDDHTLHIFVYYYGESCAYGASERLFRFAGLNKLLIQTREGGEWVTKSASAIVVPVCSRCRDPVHQNYWREAVFSVDYYG